MTGFIAVIRFLCFRFIIIFYFSCRFCRGRSLGPLVFVKVHAIIELPTYASITLNPIVLRWHVDVIIIIS